MSNNKSIQILRGSTIKNDQPNAEVLNTKLLDGQLFYDRSTNTLKIGEDTTNGHSKISDSLAITVANSAVTTAKIKDSAITTDKIVNSAVTTAKLSLDNTNNNIATSSGLGLVKSSSTGTTAGRDYNIQVKNDGTMKVNVPWADTHLNYYNHIVTAWAQLLGSPPTTYATGFVFHFSIVSTSSDSLTIDGLKTFFNENWVDNKYSLYPATGHIILRKDADSGGEPFPIIGFQLAPDKTHPAVNALTVAYYDPSSSYYYYSKGDSSWSTTLISEIALLDNVIPANI